MVKIKSLIGILFFIVGAILIIYSLYKLISISFNVSATLKAAQAYETHSNTTVQSSEVSSEIKSVTKDRPFYIKLLIAGIILNLIPLFAARKFN